MGSMGSIPPLERQASNMTIASIPGGAEDEAVEFLEDGAETLATRETKSPSGAGGGERKGPDSAETRGGDAKNTPTRTPQAAAAARLTRRKTRRKTRVSSPP